MSAFLRTLESFHCTNCIEIIRNGLISIRYCMECNEKDVLIKTLMEAVAKLRKRSQSEDDDGKHQQLDTCKLKKAKTMLKDVFFTSFDA